jgi:putative chitinase
MTVVTLEQLEKLFETTRKATLEKYVDALNETLEKYEITTPQRIAMFMAQVGHESGGLTITEESLNYRPERLQVIFPKYFHNVDVNEYAHKPEKIANRVYSNRMGNGDEESGDGYKFRGRGFIQITGRDNYTGFSKDNGMSVDEAVEYMETPEGACMSAGWFWNKHGLNGFADRNDCRGATVRINGGTIGLEEREEIYKEALELFS